MKKIQKDALRDLAKSIGFDVNDVSTAGQEDLLMLEQKLSIISKAMKIHKKLKTTKFEKIKRRIKFEIDYYKKQHKKNENAD